MQLRNPLKRDCPREVIDGLVLLTQEFPARASYVSDMLMYATIGRDRATLTMSYVEDTRRECETMERVFGDSQVMVHAL